MPSYATEAAVQLAAGGAARLLQIADFDDDGIVDTGLVDTAIDEAEDLINSYVRKRREVPVSPVPDVLIRLAANMAVFVLKSWRDMLTEADMMLHDQHMDWLRAFAKGLVVLGVDPSPTASPLNSPRYTSRPSTKEVSREKLKGYH